MSDRSKHYFSSIFLAFLIRYLYFLSILQRIADAIPTHWLIAVKFFRVMGYGFLVFYSLGLLPGAFAIPTGIGDIFVGLTAPIVTYIVYLRKPFSKNLGIIWNFIGIADLLVAVTFGILTYQWLTQIIPTEVSNNQIALTPLITVPVFAVPLSILLHLFYLRSLKRSKSNATS